MLDLFIPHMTMSHCVTVSLLKESL